MATDLKTSPQPDFPDVEGIKDKIVKDFGTDISSILSKQIRNIFDDLVAIRDVADAATVSADKVKADSADTSADYLSGKVDGITITVNTGTHKLVAVVSTGGASNFIGSLTRDMATASGTQAVTGLGFSPKALHFIAMADANDKSSDGVDNGTTRYCRFCQTGAFYYDSDYSIYMSLGSGNTYVGKITALGADGFTITWTKNNSPTGDLKLVYMAYR